MLRDAAQTIGNLIDNQSVSFISSVDSDGFPNTKAMLPSRVREGDTMYYSKGVSDPDYCVLRFTAKNSSYYTNFSSQDFEIE